MINSTLQSSLPRSGYDFHGGEAAAPGISIKHSEWKRRVMMDNPVLQSNFSSGSKCVSGVAMYPACCKARVPPLADMELVQISSANSQLTDRGTFPNRNLADLRSYVR